MNQEKIGKFIQECRNKKELTQEELAKKIGVTNKAISRWENGHGLPDLSLLKPLCNELDIDINDLLNGQKIEEKNRSEQLEENIDKIINQATEQEKKERKKSLKTISTISIIFIIVISILAIIINNYEKEQQSIILENSNPSVIYEYNQKLLNISNYMNSISIPSDNFYWWELKDLNLEDKTYEKTLNNLLSNIRMCYIGFTDNGTYYTESNPLYKYLEKEKITQEELNILTDKAADYYCLSYFSTYELILISKNEEKNQEVINLTKKAQELLNSELYTKKNLTFDELITKEMQEITLIEEYAKWLYEEYEELTGKKFAY